MSAIDWSRKIFSSSSEISMRFINSFQEIFSEDSTQFQDFFWTFGLSSWSSWRRQSTSIPEITFEVATQFQDAFPEHLVCHTCLKLSMWVWRNLKPLCQPSWSHKAFWELSKFDAFIWILRHVFYLVWFGRHGKLNYKKWNYSRNIRNNPAEIQLISASILSY